MMLQMNMYAFYALYFFYFFIIAFVSWLLFKILRVIFLKSFDIAQSDIPRMSHTLQLYISTFKV